MQLEAYRYKDQKKLRCGYTTGSCAAAAAKAAAWMLLNGQAMEQVLLQTPGGILLTLPLQHVERTEDFVSCAVQKDSGDDADVTDGILIYARAFRKDAPGVSISGGEGIGRVTKEGLEQPPGSYAINRVPRQMIRQAAEQVIEAADYEGGLSIVISAPEGEALAARTFNPALGIEGGISILGTSGIVEPMSEKALVDTIALEMKMQAAGGKHLCILTPGNYGRHFIGEALKLDLKQTIKCSNFIGDAMDMAPAYQMEALLLVGHLGKLVKLGAGIMNTHSRYGDSRMEILSACVLETEAPAALAKRILGCITTDEAVSLLQEEGWLSPVMERLMERIGYHLQRRAYEGIQIEAVVFSNQHGLLGQTKAAWELIERIRKEAI